MAAGGMGHKRGGDVIEFPIAGTAKIQQVDVASFAAWLMVPGSSMRKLFHYLHKSPDGRATFARFTTVGLTMAVLDLAVLYLLLFLGVGVYAGRAASHLAAICVGYFLNRRYSFHHVTMRRGMWRSLFRHLGVHTSGGVLNYGVFAVIVFLGRRAGIEPGASSLLPLFAVWVGGVAGLGFNFFFAKRLVFDH